LIRTSGKHRVRLLVAAVQGIPTCRAERSGGNMRGLEDRHLEAIDFLQGTSGNSPLINKKTKRRLILLLEDGKKRGPLS